MPISTQNIVFCSSSFFLLLPDLLKAFPILSACHLIRKRLAKILWNSLRDYKPYDLFFRYQVLHKCCFTFRETLQELGIRSRKLKYNRSWNEKVLARRWWKEGPPLKTCLSSHKVLLLPRHITLGLMKQFCFYIFLKSRDYDGRVVSFSYCYLECQVSSPALTNIQT